MSGGTRSVPTSTGNRTIFHFDARYGTMPYHIVCLTMGYATETMNKSKWICLVAAFATLLLVDSFWKKRVLPIQVGRQNTVNLAGPFSIFSQLCIFVYSYFQDGPDRAPRLRSVHFHGLTRSDEAKAQHLLLDLANCSEAALNNPNLLESSARAIADHMGTTVANLHTTPLSPHGFGLVANMGDSHLVVHTWPEEGDALIDILVADDDNEANLRKLLPLIADLFQGDINESTFSIHPRGRGVNPGDNEAYSPPEIMMRHFYKRNIDEVQSAYQHVAVWEYHDTLDEEPTQEVTRGLFLDGVMQSSIADEFQYHESLVQPAFVSTASPPKRVLIVGGGEGGTLRETLKWKSIQTTVMVDLDDQVIKTSRRHLYTYSNCTGFGTPSCFDDPRLELYTEDFFGWFDRHIGQDICQNRHTKKDLLFDVIVLDLLDTEELPQGQEWAEYLYSDLFFERIACAVADNGVLVSNFGESPESPYEPEVLDTAYPMRVNMTRTPMFQQKIRQLQSMSRHFMDFRVYDTFVPAFRSPWAFAIGIVPRVTREPSRRGIEYFDGTPVMINYKLRHNLFAKADMLHYSGRIQGGFQQPTADWAGVYCATFDKEIRDLCNITQSFLEDDASLWEVKTRNGENAVVALKDLAKGSILGAWDEIAAPDKKLSGSLTTSCNFNVAKLPEVYPLLAKKEWIPERDWIQSEVSHAVVLLQDVRTGEKLTLKADDC